jgi:molybdopterin synthase catalytic subunit
VFATRGPIDVSRLLAEVQDSGRGGTTLFVGSVRAGKDDGAVEAIEYSAYEAMLEAEFGRIVAEAEARWAGSRVRAVHRLGIVPLGDASIVVAAAAPHREAAFEACRYVIEEAKRRLPVWKKERLPDGALRWREG